MKLFSKLRTAPLFLLPFLLLLSACGAASAPGEAGTAAGSAGAGSRSAGSAFDKAALNRRFPAYEYGGKDPVEKLVYDAEAKRNPIDKDGYFVVVSPKIIDMSRERDLLKVFAISYGGGYKIYSDNTVYMDSGWNFPAALTYQKQPDGTYSLKKYEMPQEGRYADSVRSFCKAPATGAEIVGLPERMMQSYDLEGNLNRNLQAYLKENKVENAKIRSG